MHVRALVLTLSPHVLEQEVQAIQSAHWPSTLKIYIHLNFSGFKITFGLCKKDTRKSSSLGRGFGPFRYFIYIN